MGDEKVTGNRSEAGVTVRTASAEQIARDEAELAQDRREQAERRRQIATLKAETGFDGADLLREWVRRGGSLT